MDANTVLTFVLSIATTFYATILFWEHYTDVPQLNIQTKDIKISKEVDFYSIKVPVLNNGRKDAIGWHGRIQIFNRECGNKVYDSKINRYIPLAYGTDDWRHTSPPTTNVNANQPVYDRKIEPAGNAYFSVELPSFEGDFVAVIGVVTHNSNDNKIIRYYMDPTYIEIKYRIWPTYAFVLESLFLRKYQNNWDIDIFREGLKLDDLDARRKIFSMLGQTGDVGAVEPLVDCMEHDLKSIRNTAACALGDLEIESAVTPLLKYIQKESESVDVRIICGVRALEKIFKKIGGEKYVFNLIIILENKSESIEIRAAVAKLLGKIGKNIEKEEKEKIEKSLISVLEEACISDADIKEWKKPNILSDIFKALGNVGCSKPALNVLKNLNEKYDYSDIENTIYRIKRRMRYNEC